jgi:hypothetical protein
MEGMASYNYHSATAASQQPKKKVEQVVEVDAENDLQARQDQQ